MCCGDFFPSSIFHKYCKNRKYCPCHSLLKALFVILISAVSKVKRLQGSYLRVFLERVCLCISLSLTLIIRHLVLPMMTPSGLSIGTILKTNRSLRALATWELPVRQVSYKDQLNKKGNTGDMVSQGKNSIITIS